MISECLRGLVPADVNPSVVTLSGGIGSAGGVESVFGKACYFNACMYKMTPQYESLYLKEMAHKQIKRKDDRDAHKAADRVWSELGA